MKGNMHFVALACWKSLTISNCICFRMNCYIWIVAGFYLSVMLRDNHKTKLEILQVCEIVFSMVVLSMSLQSCEKNLTLFYSLYFLLSNHKKDVSILPFLNWTSVVYFLFQMHDFIYGNENLINGYLYKANRVWL